MIHGDSVYDIIDKQDHQAIQCELGRPVNSGSNSNPSEEIRLFLCRMNVSRNARRQMRFGDQKVLIKYHNYNFLFVHLVRSLVIVSPFTLAPSRTN